jgi:hypothetical protein
MLWLESGCWVARREPELRDSIAQYFAALTANLSL